MKTAEDILRQTDTAFVNDSRTLFEWDDVIKAMKEFAKENLKECLNSQYEIDDEVPFKVIDINVVKSLIKKL